MTEADLLAGILAHPDELDRWLILSDLLEDQDDPRAELARLRYLLHAEAEFPERGARLLRQQALLDAGLRPVVPTWTNSLGMAFALILPGTFLMGSPASEPHRYGDETLHTVELTQPFHLGIYPVTVGEFGRFVQAAGYAANHRWQTPGFEQTARHPVVNVSWADASAMIAWLNQTDPEESNYSLPSEAQWEYACRAGTRTAFWWGDDVSKLGEYAWFEDNSGKTTHPVDTKGPNPWGLYQMLGNVLEWSDAWDGLMGSGRAVDPQGPGEGGRRVLRGGRWDGEPTRCRSAYRANRDPGNRDNDVGFRLQMTRRPAN